MSDSEFYDRARSDAAFCSAQLEELRYRRKLAIALGTVGGVFWLAYAAYCQVTATRWPGDLGVTFLLALCGVVYSQAQARAAALQTISTTGKAPVPAGRPRVPVAGEPGASVQPVAFSIE